MSADDRDPALPGEEPTPAPADPTTTDQAPEPAPDTEATVAATDPAAGAPVTADGAPAPAGPVGWVPPDDDASEPTPPPGRGMLLAAWIVGGIGLGLAAWLTYVVAIGGDAYRAGVFVGAVAGPIILVALIRFFLVKLHVAKGRVLRSPWIPLGAGLLAIVLAVSRIGLAAPLAPVDPATGLHVAAPFQIVATDSQVVSNMEAALGDNEAIRSSVIRSVVGQDGSTSILFIADGEFRDADLDEVARGMGENAGAEPTVETIGGHKVVIASLPNGSLATWITEPLVYTVVAADRPTLDQVVAAVIAGE